MPVCLPNRLEVMVTGDSFFEDKRHQPWEPRADHKYEFITSKIVCVARLAGTHGVFAVGIMIHRSII